MASFSERDSSVLLEDIATVELAILGTGGTTHQLNGARFGHLDSEFDNDFLDRIEFDPLTLSETTHQEIMEAARAEAVELTMWLPSGRSNVPAGTWPKKREGPLSNNFRPLHTQQLTFPAQSRSPED